jgi:hypothetical protein
VPRGGSSRSGNEGATRGSGSTNASAGADESQGHSRAPVPAYSRPRDGRTPLGTVAERRGSLPGRGDNVYYPGIVYDPYYYDYYGRRYTSLWSPYGFGYGLGYFSYDPFLFGGYGYDPYSAYGSGYGYGYGSGSGYGYNQGYRDVGALRLKVKPSNAQVYIDGYYVGVVDSFDGAFQKLGIESGTHRVELRAEGYEPAQFEVLVAPGETITYKGELKRR